MHAAGRPGGCERGGNCHKAPLKSKARTPYCQRDFAEIISLSTSMAENGKKSGKSGAREDRLAAALRENLRRRKAQERARASAPAPSPPEKPDQAKDDDESR